MSHPKTTLTISCGGRSISLDGFENPFAVLRAALAVLPDDAAADTADAWPGADALRRAVAEAAALRVVCISSDEAIVLRPEPEAALALSDRSAASDPLEGADLSRPWILLPAEPATARHGGTASAAAEDAADDPPPPDAAEDLVDVSPLQPPTFALPPPAPPLSLRDGAARFLRDGGGREDAAAAPDADGPQWRTLDRLLDETDAQFDAADGSRRRRALAHMRQAVAATRAEEALRDRAGLSAPSLSRFREDLRAAIRHPPAPHPPAAQEAPPPLRLLGSQRADAREAGPEAPDPGRDAAEPEDAALAARLEAAVMRAVESGEAEGLTRAELVRRTAVLGSGRPVPREEWLRSLGQLLRSGRLRRCESGRLAPGVPLAPDD